MQVNSLGFLEGRLMGTQSGLVIAPSLDSLGFLGARLSCVPKGLALTRSEEDDELLDLTKTCGLRLAVGSPEKALE